NLSARTASGPLQRQDEIGDLVRDFNAMASRIEELISRQRQLISDVSHELRSPLARLNVALDLGRERKGNDPAFEQMEEDLHILDDLIGRLLTIAKLDMSAPEVPMVDLDLTDICRRLPGMLNLSSRSPEAPFNSPRLGAVWCAAMRNSS